MGMEAARSNGMPNGRWLDLKGNLQFARIVPHLTALPVSIYIRNVLLLSRVFLFQYRHHVSLQIQQPVVKVQVAENLPSGAKAQH